MINSNEIIEKLEKRLMTFSNDPKTDNVGKVIKNTDGVITASGLSRVGMGEIVIFQTIALVSYLISMKNSYLL